MGNGVCTLLIIIILDTLVYKNINWYFQGTKCNLAQAFLFRARRYHNLGILRRFLITSTVVYLLTFQGFQGSLNINKHYVTLYMCLVISLRPSQAYISFSF